MSTTRPSRLRRHLAFVLISSLFGFPLVAQEPSYVQLDTAHGTLEGVVSGDGKVRTFKGIPYAAPPIGDLRWKPPHPVTPWEGVRLAHDYPPRAMQVHVWDDMFFYDDGPSEDCLYLNLWMPAKPETDKLPVMFWIHGGGFIAGSTSEPRQDGGNLSKKGVLVVSLTYRMGIFGFFAHPELSAESARNASGNYGMLDMVAALEWVRDNIATFGGDPNNVTIFGESAGSMAVSALMASPQARGLFHKAIGESGGALNRSMQTRKEAEKQGLEFVEAEIGDTSLAALRAMPAQELLEISQRGPRFRPNIDGLFLIENPVDTYATGRQSHVPLLAGWNLDEGGAGALFGDKVPTLANFQAAAKERFGDDADAFLAAYAASTDHEAKRAAQDYGGDRFIGYGTWKWLEEHERTGTSPVYRYMFDHPLPLPADAPADAEPRAAHSWEIEYVFRVISSKDLPWRDEDWKVSELISTYWTNFAKHGDPNSSGLLAWPQYNTDNGRPVMHLNPTPSVTSDDHRARYEFLEAR